MRNCKTILLLLLMIGALAAANVAIRMAGRGRQVSARRFLADLPTDVVAVSVRRPGEAETALRRDGAVWRLVAPYAGTADGRVVLRLVDALAQTPVLDVISETDLVKLGRQRSDFALEDPVLAVTLTCASGDRCVCAFGAPTPAADGIYALVEGVGAVFVVDSSVLAAADVSADGFRRRSVFPEDAATVSRFEIKRAGAPVLAFTRAGESWRVGGAEASAQKVTAFIAGLTSANADRFIWPTGGSNETALASTSLLAGYGLDPESAVTVTLNGVDGVSRWISFGKDSADGKAYALVQNGGAIVTVPAELKDFASQDAVMFTDSRLFQEDIRAVVFFSVATEDGLYALSRDQDGKWSLESPIVAAADQASVETLLARILSLSPSDVVAESGVAVSVATNAPKVRVARASVLGEGAIEDLRSREMLRVDPALVRRIVRMRGGDARTTSVCYSRERRLWNVENGEDGQVVRPTGVEAVLAVVNPLVATRVVKLNVPAADLDDYGLDAPFLTIAIDQDSDKAVRRNILIGKRTEGGRFATIGSADAVFVVPDAAVESLLSPVVE